MAPAILTIRPQDLAFGRGSDGHPAMMREFRFPAWRSRFILDIAGRQVEAVFSPAQARDQSIGQALKLGLPAATLRVMPDDPARDRSRIATTEGHTGCLDGQVIVSPSADRRTA